jgi:hypothetical protein
MAVLAAMWAGCAQETRRTLTPPPTPKSSLTHPSAERLHEISRALLLFYSRYRSLPPNLEALHTVEPALPPLSDPASGGSYMYLQDPIRMTGRPGWLIVYVGASEQGNRWVILGDYSDTDRNLALQVVLIPAAEVQAAVRAARNPS